eukprot:scaffold3865_cov61-Phaeocystis_antarctica.AAC.2
MEERPGPPGGGETCRSRWSQRWRCRWRWWWGGSGGEARPAVHPHDDRRVQLAVLREEEPVEELRLRRLRRAAAVATRRAAAVATRRAAAVAAMRAAVQQPGVRGCREQVLEAEDAVALVPRMRGAGEREEQPGSGAWPSTHETETSAEDVQGAPIRRFGLKRDKWRTEPGQDAFRLYTLTTKCRKRRRRSRTRPPPRPRHRARQLWDRTPR